MEPRLSGKDGLSNFPNDPKKTAQEENFKKSSNDFTGLILKADKDIKRDPINAVQQKSDTVSDVAHKTLTHAKDSDDLSHFSAVVHGLENAGYKYDANGKFYINETTSDFLNEADLEIICVEMQNRPGTFEEVIDSAKTKIAEKKQNLFKMAQIAAEEPLENIANVIQKCGLNPANPQDKEKLFELAKIAAANENVVISNHFKKCGLNRANPQDKEKLFELAKIAAANKRIGVSLYLKKYGLNRANPQDKEKLFELAKIAAAANGYGFSMSLKKYGLDPANPQDKEKLFELAKIAARDGGSQALHNFAFDPIQDKEQLFEIAKIAVAMEEDDISEYFQNYGFNPIQDREKLFQLAKIAAANKINIAENILNYGLNPANPQDKEKLFELAKIAAANKPIENLEDYEKSIQNYGLNPANPQDKEKLLELAAIGATYNKNPRIVFAVFLTLLKTYFESSDPDIKQQLLHIFNLLFSQNPSLFLDLKNLKKWPDNLLLLKQQLLMIIAEDIPSLVSAAPQLAPAFENLKNQTNPQLKKNTLEFLGFFTCQYVLAQDKAIFSKNIEALNIIDLLEKVYDPSLRISILAFIAERLNNPIVSQTKQPHHQLPVLLFDALFSKGASPESIKRGQSAIINDKRNLRDGKMGKALMNTLIALHCSKHLTSEESIQLIEKALENSNSFSATLKQLNLLYAILNMDGGDLLQQGLMRQNLDFSSLLEKASIRKIPALATEKAFGDKFLMTFQSSRSPMAIFQYAATLSRLTGTTRELTLNALSLFISSVLNDSFLTDRMAAKGNLHFEKLYSKYPDLFAEWAKGRTKEIGERSFILSNTDNPYDTLLSGTEAGGSCLNINRLPNKSRGILGSLLNGHRMITLKALSKAPDQEPIIGRAFFRLLLDSEEKPVLLLDMIYPQKLEKAKKNEIKVFALECATQLNCPLVSVDEGNPSKPYGKTVKSLGGRIDELVDSVGGIQPDAKYAISDANYVTAL